MESVPQKARGDDNEFVRWVVQPHSPGQSAPLSLAAIHTERGALICLGLTMQNAQRLSEKYNRLVEELEHMRELDTDNHQRSLHLELAGIEARDIARNLIQARDELIRDLDMILGYIAVHIEKEDGHDAD